MLQRVFFIVCFLVRTTDTATQSQLQSQPHTLHIPHIPPFHQYSVSFIVFFNKDNKYSDRSIFSRRRHYLCVRLLQAPDISPLLLHVASIWKVIILDSACGLNNYHVIEICSSCNCSIKTRFLAKRCKQELLAHGILSNMK